MSDSDYPSFQEPYRRWSAAQTTTTSLTSLTSALLTTVAGACVLLVALEHSGYSARVWIRRIVHMSLDALPLPRPEPEAFASASASASDTDEDTVPRPTGMLSSIDGLFRRGYRGITGALSSAPSNVPPGLGNISNSCYQNSVIQGLAALPSLRNYLEQITTEHATFTTETTNGALHELIAKLNDPGNRGRNFWIPGKLKSMSTFTQQDAQEYYSKILDQLDTEARKASSSKRRSSVSLLEATKALQGSLPAAHDEKASGSKDAKPEQTTSEQPSILPNPLDGLLAQRVGCTTCGYSDGLSMIPFNCITVSLGSNNFYDIRDCLEEYTKLEYIDGVECAKCTLLKLQKTLTPLAEKNPGSAFAKRLNDVLDIIDNEKFEDNTLVKTMNIPKKNWAQSAKSKQIVVARAPKSLVLHVNRSIFDETTGAQYKNTASVSYPSTLDLGNWCLGSSPSGSRQPDMSLEEWPRDPNKSMLADTHARTDASPFQYRLRAVVTHAGTHGYGHYVCYRPHARIVTQSEDNHEDAEEPQGEQWWRFSDDSVNAVPESQAHQGQVFMLFYERCDEPVSSQPPDVKPTLETFPVAEDAPLPPVDMSDLVGVWDDSEVAAVMPLPDDDELFNWSAPEWAHIQPLTSESSSSSSSSLSQVDDTSTPAPAYPTPPPDAPIQDTTEDIKAEATNHDTETEMSEAESEDASSTQFASDSETELVSPPTPKPFVPMQPHIMRTAGNASTRGQGNRSRQSLPMVSPT